MRLNGWQRLWVVLATLWAFVVLVFGYAQWPVDYTALRTPGPVPNANGGRDSLDALAQAYGATGPLAQRAPRFLDDQGNLMPESFVPDAPMPQFDPSKPFTANEKDASGNAITRWFAPIVPIGAVVPQELMHPAFYDALAKLVGGKNMADLVAETLLAASTTDDVRVAALRAFYSSTTEGELTTKFLPIPLPKDVKGNLRALKRTEVSSVPFIDFIDRPLSIAKNEPLPFFVSHALALSRMTFAGWLLALWAIPATFSYGLGWSLGWVYRGFRPDASGVAGPPSM